MKNLLEFLLAFLRPAVDGDDGAGDAAGDAGAAGGDDKGAAADAGDDQLDLDLDAHQDDDKGGDDDTKLASKDELEAERRARQAERERADRYEREAAELRAKQYRPAPDDETAKEEAKLADPNTPDLEKWQIRSNRAIRQGMTAAQAALAQAEDVRDQTRFASLATTEPALYKRYAPKVEEALANIRKGGANVAREAIYNQLIAADMRAGKFKKKAASPAADPNKKQVDRGRMPGARSDVSGKGQMSNRERLAKKLDGVQI